MVMKEEEVETLVYTPISYLQYNIEMNIADSQIKPKRRRNLTHAKAKRNGSLIDFSSLHFRKDNLRERSKTLFDRPSGVDENDGLFKSPSVDHLAVHNKKNECFTNSFSDLVRRSAPNDKIAARAKVTSARRKHLFPASDRRSRSCSDFPESDGTLKVHKQISKSNSFDVHNSTNSAKIMSPVLGTKPIITIQLAENNENDHYEECFSPDNVKFVSNSSMTSVRSDYGTDSDNERYLSDCSSVFASEGSTHSRFNSFVDSTPDISSNTEENFYSRSSERNARPCSMVEISKTEDFDTSSSPSVIIENHLNFPELDVKRGRSQSHCVTASSSSSLPVKEELNREFKSDKDLFSKSKNSKSQPWFVKNKLERPFNRLSKKNKPTSLSDVRKAASVSEHCPDRKSFESKRYNDSSFDSSNEDLKNFIATDKHSKESIFQKFFKKRAKSLPTRYTNRPCYRSPDIPVKKLILIESNV